MKGSSASTSAGLAWPGLFFSVCLVVLSGCALLFVAVLLSSALTWRVRVWRWARLLDRIRRWHGARCPLRAAGKKLPGHQGVGDSGDVKGTLALIGLPSVQSNDTSQVLKLSRAHNGNNGQTNYETSSFSSWSFFGESSGPRHPSSSFAVSTQPLLHVRRGMGPAMTTVSSCAGVMGVSELRFRGEAKARGPTDRSLNAPYAWRAQSQADHPSLQKVGRH